MKKNINKNRNKKDLLGKDNYDEQVATFVRIGIGVIVFLIIIFLITAIATGEIKLGNKKTEETKETTIQYEEIIAGQIMNRKVEEYYVLVFDFTSDQASYYLSLRDGYKQKNDALSFYIVDSEKAFNQSLKPNEEEHYEQKPDKVENLKTPSPTLLKIKQGKIVERTEGNDEVTKKLESIA